MGPLEGVEFVSGDVRDVPTVAASLAGAEVLVHLVGIREAPGIMEACRRAGHRRVVFINTTGIYSRYREVAAEYVRIEETILGSDLEYTIIRPTMIYGNHRDKNIHRLVKIVNRLPVIPIVGGGRGLMQPIYARDLAAVTARAALSPHVARRAYNVAGKEPLSYREVLQEIAAALGKKRYLVNVPYGLALAAGQVGELFPCSLLTVERVQRLLEDKVFDYTEAARDLGFAPISFQEGIRLEVAALREAGVI